MTKKQTERFANCVICGKLLDRYDVSVDVRFADDGLSGSGPRSIKCGSHVAKAR